MHETKEIDYKGAVIQWDVGYVFKYRGRLNTQVQMVARHNGKRHGIIATSLLGDQEKQLTIAALDEMKKWIDENWL